MKRVLVTLVVAMALVGAVYAAAASLTVGGVDSLGSGSKVVTSPTGGSHVAITDVSWTIDPSDITYVSAVEVTVSESDVNTGPAACSVGVYVDDGWDYYDLIGAVSVPNNASGTIESDTTGPLAFEYGLSASDISSVTVTLACEP